MTLDQAKARLEERGLRLEKVGDVYVVLPVSRVKGSEYEPERVSTGLTYQEAYANATGEAPY